MFFCNTVCSRNDNEIYCYAKQCEQDAACPSYSQLVNRKSRHYPNKTNKLIASIINIDETEIAYYYDYTTCPCILYKNTNNSQLFPVECHNLNVNVECFMDKTIIKMEGEWINTTSYNLCKLKFILPTSSEIVNISVSIGSDHKLLTVSKINDINVVRLPFNNVGPGDSIKIKCDYIEQIDDNKDGCIASLPLYFPHGYIAKNKSWDEVVNIHWINKQLT